MELVSTLFGRAVAQPHEMALARLLFQRRAAGPFPRTSWRAVSGSRETSTLKARRALASTEAWKAAELAPALVGEFQPAVELLLHMRQHVAHDDVADLLELDAGADQFLAAQRFRLAELARA